MKPIIIVSVLLAASAGPAVAAPRPAVPAAAPAVAPDAGREERYLRQQLAVDNARIEVETLRAQVKLKDELLELARVRNAELYQVASEILARHAGRRSWEPFIQSSKVRLENLVQSYEDRLRAARVTEATLPPSVDAQMQKALAPAAAPKTSASPEPK